MKRKLKIKKEKKVGNEEITGKKKAKRRSEKEVRKREKKRNKIVEKREGRNKSKEIIVFIYSVCCGETSGCL